MSSSASSSTMKAAVALEWGGPEVVRVADVPRPAGPEHATDVVVRNYAFASNPVDFKVLANFGAPGPDAASPWTAIPESGRIVGWDAAGEVVAVGEAVTRVAVGDHVCYAGVIDRQGSFAEYTLVDEALVAKKPASLDWAEAASVPLTTLTAFEGLTQQLGIAVPTTPEQREANAKLSLVVIAAAGGVGSSVVQLAKHYLGIQVVGTASRPETQEWVKSLGADHTINHHDPLRPQLEALGFENGHVDFVFSAFDIDKVFDEAVDVLKPFGRMVVIAGSGDSVAIGKLKVKSLTLSLEFMYTRGLFKAGAHLQGEAIATVLDLIERGVIRHTLTKRFPFTTEGVQACLAQQASGKSIGKNAVEIVVPE